MQWQASILVLCLLALSAADGASLRLKSGVHRDLCEWGPQYWCSSEQTAERCGKTSYCQENEWAQEIIRDDRCRATQDLVKSARAMMSGSKSPKQMTEQDIAFLLAKVCGGEKEQQPRMMCKDIVTDSHILPKLVKLVLTRLPTMSVAVAVGGCRRQEVKHVRCETECGNVIKTLQLAAGTVFTRDHYMNMFKPACAKTGMGHQICEAMASGNYEKFIQGITNAVPSEMCPKTSVCMKKPSVWKMSFTECSMCKDVVSDIRAMSRSSEVQSAVRSLMKSACTHLGEFKDLCDTLADEGLTYVWELVATEMEPEVICERLSLCSDPENVLVPKGPAKPSPMECTLCKLVMEEIDQVLQDGDKEAKVLAILDKLCSGPGVPSSVRQECTAFVAEYGKTIIELASKLLQPGTLCPLLHLCADDQASLDNQPLPNFEDGENELCELCEYLVTYLDTELKKNTTVEEIKALLTKVCDALPASLKTTCSSLVTQYFPLLEAFLKKGFPPKQACQGVKMCPASNSAKKEVQAGDDTECYVCKLVVTQLTHLLSEKSTKEEVDDALEKVCQLLPQASRDSCTSVIDTYAPLILQLIADEMEPSQVCSLLNLCPPQSASVVKAPPSLIVGKERADLCALCEFVMQELDGILKENSTEQEIEAALKEVCQFLPSTLRAECETLVTQYTPTLIDLLLSYTPKQVCSLAGLCSSTRAAASFVKAPPSLIVGKERADLCSLCEFVMQELDGILKENSTEQEIEAALKEVCQILPSTLRAECETLVTQYTATLVDLLLSYTPKQVCSLAGLCSSTRAAASVVKAPPSLIVGKERADLCSLCEFVMQELDGILKENSTEQEIEAALKEVCQFLPSTLRAECETLVTQYTATLVDLLLSYTPKEVCSLAGLCSSTRAAASVAKAPPSLNVGKERADLCSLCEFVMQELDGILKENSTEQEIEAALKEVCQFLPSTLRAECETLVTQYTATLVDLLLSYTPKEVCSLAGLCSSTRAAASVAKAPPSLNVGKERADLCSLCEFVMQELDGILKENSTEQEIEAALKEVCQFLPSTLRAECETLVAQYTPTLIDLLLSYTPKQVCSLAGLCSSTRAADTITVTSPTVRKLQADLCPICELVVKQLDTVLGENSTEQAIEAALDQVCDFLPDTVKTECVALVTQYTPTIIQLVLAYSPSDVCKLLGLCPQAYKVDTSKMATPMVRKLQADLCPICELVIKQLDTVLGDNKTEQSIEAALDQVCDFLPGTVKTECEALVKQYTPTIIQLVLAYSPSDVCKLLGLCPQAYKVNTSKMATPMVRKLQADLCPICELVIKQLDTVLGENKTEQSIEAALDQVCEFLPGTVKTECEALVKQYLPTIIQLVLAYSPSDVCKLLGLCPQAYKMDTSKMATPMVRKLQADLCPICELVIKQLDTVLGDNKTEQSIEAALDQVCEFLPGTVKTECEALVKQYLPTIIQLVLAYSPSDVCKLLGLCPQAYKMDTSKMATPMVRKLQADLCPICELVIKQLDTVLGDNKTEQSIEAALDQVCDFLPGTVKTECEALVKQYLPTIIQLVLAYSPSDVCKLLGLCPQAYKEIQLPVASEMKLSAGPLCPICELVIKQLDTVLGENKTEQSIEAALDQVCDFLPGTVKTECESLVTQYTPTIIQLVLAYSPSDVCKLLGLCPQASKEIQLPVASEMKLSAGPLCPICELVIKQLDTVLGENKTEQSIEAALDQVCDLLPGTVKTECESLVTQYTPTIIQLVLAYSPSDVCKLLGLCPQAYKEIQLPVASEMKLSAGPLCPICELVIKQLDGVLGENKTEQSIEAALDQVCDFLPGTVKTECESLVTQYTPTIIQLVLAYSPSDVCKLLGLCPQAYKEIQLPAASEIKLSAGPLCPICELVMTELDSILKENSTEQEIETALDIVCQLLPATVKTECESLVKQFTPNILQLLVARLLQPQQVCTALRFCTTQAPLDAKLKLPVASEVKSPDDTLCVLCEYAMSELDNLLTKNSTEQQIAAALDLVCQLLPSTLKTECDALIQQFTPLILQLLVENLQPKQVCTTLALCPMAATQPRSHATTDVLKVEKGELCPLCTFVFTSVDKMLDSNRTKQEVTTLLEKVCDILPAAIKDECEPFVDLYAPYVVDLIVQKYSPSFICQSLGLCTEEIHEDTLEVSRIAKQVELKKGQLCPLCTFVFTTVDQTLDSNRTKQEVTALLDKVCDILPAAIKDECEPFVGLYAPYVVDLIVQKYSPSFICQSLGLCTNATIPAAVRSVSLPKTNVGESELCSLCEYVLQYLDNVLAKNSTEAEIEQALEYVCAIVPASLKDQCDALIEMWTPQLIAYILQEVQPNQICVSIGLCNAHVEKEKEVKVATSVQMADDDCGVCQTVLTYVDAILKDQATQAEVESALAKVCDIVPSSIAVDCKKYIKQYFYEIVDLLLDFPPSEICRLINLCPSPKELHVPQELKCDLCEMVIGELESMISSTSTEDEIETALEKVCSLLPASLKGDCDDLVETYTPTLIKLLLQETRPRQVCIELGVCSNDDQVKQSKPQHRSTKAGPLCPLCELVAQNLDKMLQQNSTQAEIEQALLQVCSVLPSTLKKECLSLVAVFAPQIVDFLVKEMKPEVICKQLNLCVNTTMEIKPINAILNVKDEECDLCTMVMSELDSLLSDKSTQEEIQNALDFVCTRILPQSFSDECVKLVHDTEPLIVWYLTQSMSPKDICVLLSACKPSLRKLNVQQSKPQHRSIKAGPLCPLCELVAQNLDKILEKNSTQAQIEQALEQVCNVLPQTLRKDCVSFVVLFAPQVVDFLVKEMNPGVICKQLNLCPNATVVEVKSTKVQGVECDLCEMVIKEVLSKVSSKSSEADIEAALKEVCSLLPASFQSECDAFVDQYASMVINLILQDLSPQEICQELSLCPQHAALIKGTKVQGVECDLCEMVIKEVLSKVSSKSSVADIEAALKEVCSLLPASFQSECDAFVDQYASMVINLILQDLSPQEICQELSLCPQHAALVKGTKVQGVECDLCEMVIKEVLSKVSSKSSVADIEAALKEVCSLLPASFQSECDAFVDQYASMVINLILQDLSPQEICQELSLCPQHGALIKGTKVQGVECDRCEMVIKEVLSKVSSKSSVADIEAALKEVCSLLPASFQSECDAFVDQYASMVINLILQDLSPQEICQELSLCPQHAALIKAAKSNDVNCDLCEKVVDKLRSEISSKSSEAEIEAALDKACDVVPAYFQSECKVYVKNYGQAIVKLMLEGASSESICQKLELCPAGALKVVSPGKQTTESVSCVLCDLVVGKLKSMISSKATEAEIVSAMEKVCSILPESLREECDSFVEEYGDMVVKLILNQITADQICKELRLCATNVNIRTDVTNVEACTLCEFVLEEAKGFLKDKPTVAALTDALEFVCQKLPSELSGPCQDLAIMFGPDLVVYLDGKIAPKQMCQLVKLCPPPKLSSQNVLVQKLSRPPLVIAPPPKSLTFKSERKTRQAPTTPPSDMPDCSACKFALYEVQNALATPFWQDESPKIMNQLCDRIEQWPDVCKFMVQANIAKIITQARGFRFPIEFCQDLQLCEPPKTSTVALVKLSPETRCNLCDRLVRYMAYTDVEGAMDAESVCGFLVPEEQKPHCLSLVQKYSTLLMELLKKHQDPSLVCQTVNVCPKPSAQQPWVIKLKTVF